MKFSPRSWHWIHHIYMWQIIKKKNSTRGKKISNMLQKRLKFLHMALKIKLFVSKNDQRMKSKVKKIEFETWKTEKLIQYQDDKQLYRKIYEKKGNQWRELHFLHTFSDCLDLLRCRYNIISPTIFSPILILMLSATCTVFFCLMFLWDSIDWKTSLFVSCSWLRYSFHGF